jgi:NAD(P) transhydrogenase subunit alpha
MSRLYVDIQQPALLMDIALIVVFVLAAFVGMEVISKVPATLHTPLMSGSNAISGITIVGALVVAGMVGTPFAKWLGFAALVMATINVVGGFLVTDRMLQMFKKKDRKKLAAEPEAATVNGAPREAVEA